MPAHLIHFLSPGPGISYSASRNYSVSRKSYPKNTTWASAEISSNFFFSKKFLGWEKLVKKKKSFTVLSIPLCFYHVYSLFKFLSDTQIIQKCGVEKLKEKKISQHFHATFPTKDTYSYQFVVNSFRLYIRQYSYPNKSSVLGIPDSVLIYSNDLKKQ